MLQLPDECHADAVRLLEKLLSVLGERKSGRDLATNFKAVYSQMQYTADGRSLAHELVMQLIALLSRTPVRVWLLLSLVCARAGVGHLAVSTAHRHNRPAALLLHVVHPRRWRSSAQVERDCRAAPQKYLKLLVYPCRVADPVGGEVGSLGCGSKSTAPDHC